VTSVPSWTAQQLIELLALERHPEGGWYRQTFEDAVSGGRAHSTAIYFLLEGGDVSAWHRVDAAEIWHWYAGAPLELKLSADGFMADGPRSETLVLGNDFSSGQRPQLTVPAHHWQSAKSLGEWTLVGCTVAPGFQFAGFELAPEGWEPGG
jgi:predicted cupin superfamily sugar epimerase